MKREELTNLLCAAVSDTGYTFHTGAAHRMNGTVRVYPAAWLEPPVLKSSEGRAEGQITYRISLHMMSLPSPEGREALWAGLEEDALGVARNVEVNPAVVRVSNISYTPAEGSLTTHGEVSVTLTCDVTLWYYI